jgi:hypothetical protein
MLCLIISKYIPDLKHGGIFDRRIFRWIWCRLIRKATVILKMISIKLLHGHWVKDQLQWAWISTQFNKPFFLVSSLMSLPIINLGSFYQSHSISFVQCLLFLVGTNVGDIGLWDVGTKERLAVRNFKVWELGKCSMALQVCLLKYVVQ